MYSLSETKGHFVSTHSRPKAAGHKITCGHNAKDVSTHSRPKAAGFDLHLCEMPNPFQLTAARRRLAGRRCAACDTQQRFNSQPPEGGWSGLIIPLYVRFWFQLTAARRRLEPAVLLP